MNLIITREYFKVKVLYRIRVSQEFKKKRSRFSKKILYDEGVEFIVIMSDDRKCALCYRSWSVSISAEILD